MSERASYSPITTAQRLQLPLNGTLYTTTRRVSPEKGTPEIGGTMAAELGSRFATSRVIAVDKAPQQHDALVIQHVVIPSEAAQLLSNWEVTTVDIGGQQFDAVVRTVILHADDYNKATPAPMSDMPIGSDNRFNGAGYKLWDRTCVKTGLPLEPVFRVDRRIYIIPQTTSGQEFTMEGTLGTTIGSIVTEGSDADRGVNILRSSVNPAGNGNAVKNTATANRRTTSNVYEVGHPKRQIKSLGNGGDVPSRYADQVADIETTEQVELAAANVDDIPTPETPAGNVTQIVHEKVNDHRYQKKTVAKQINLNADWLDVDIDARPGVKITRRARGGLTSQPPATGSGGSQLVYKAGDLRIYENTDVDAEARPGIKGYDQSSQQWGYVREKTEYTTDSTAPADGSVRVIYDDGEVTVYERTTIDEVAISGTTKDKDPQQWGFSIWNGTYADAEDANADRSKQIWRRGNYRVWLNESVTTEVSGGTKDKDPQRWGTLTWLGAYAEAEDGAADRSRQIWRIGEKRVFLNESLQIEVNGQEVEKNPQQWGFLQWQKNYSTVQNLSADRSSQVWRMGDKTVYLNETATATPSGTTKDKDPQRFGTLTWTGEYGTSEEAGADRSRQIFRLGNQVVYLNETVELELSGQSIDKNPQPWGFEIWTGGFEETYDGAADRSRQIWKLGDKTVFLNETVEADISGTTKDKDPQQWGEVVWNGTYGDSESGSADRSRQIWRIGNKRVYLNETATLGISGGTKDINFQEWGELVWTGTYADASGGDRSRQVYRLGNKHVFLNEEIAIQNVGGSSNSSQPNEWGTLKWLGSYSTSQDLSSGSRSRAVFQAKGLSVYLNETPEVVIDSGEFISAREENPLLIETQRTSYGTGPTSGTNTRSRVVFSLGGHRVYENITIERQPKGSRTYNDIINVNLPNELLGVDVSTASYRNGSIVYHFNTNISPGYSGPITAEVTESWSENPGVAVAPQQFRPTAISFWSPVGGISISECLHGEINHSLTTGTNHPSLEFATYTLNAPATTPSSLQGLNYVARVESQPYLGGYITRVYRVQL